MQVVTIKAKPKTIFGIFLAVTGIIVILLTFISNHSAKPVEAPKNINCATPEQRASYLTSLGWEFSGEEEQKEITIPLEFNDVYNDYNSVQKQQGFDLEGYKGKNAVIYTYNITNYKKAENVIADLIVCDDVLIGADLCDPSADNGFLKGLSENNGTS